MEILGYILQGFGIVSSIVALIVSLYVLSLKSYFQRKGENLATKEDIGFITKEVESIKTEMSYNSQFRSKVYDETKIAAIHAFEMIYNLHQSIAEFDYHDNVDEKRYNEITEAQKNAGAEYFKAEAKLYLYIGDSEMFQLFKNNSKLLLKLILLAANVDFHKAENNTIKRRLRNLNKEDNPSAYKDYVHYEKSNSIQLIRVIEDAIVKRNQINLEWNELKVQLQQSIGKFITEGKLK